MTGKLISEEGINKGLVLEFKGGQEWIIGRDPDLCQLTIGDPATSRRHLLCRQMEDGILIENLSNTNPIQVNGTEIKEPQTLHQGDTVKIGSGLFRYYSDRESAQIIDNQSSSKREGTLQDTIFGEESSDPFMDLADVNFDVSHAGRWLLKVISGPNNGAEFSMEKNHSYLLGTDSTACDIVFHDLSVSRQHARLSVTEDESLFVEDLGSRNGTQIDNQPIAGKQKINTNTIVTLGTTSFVAIDRQNEQSTIVPPSLATFGRVVKNEEALQAVQAAVQKVSEDPAGKEANLQPPTPQPLPRRFTNGAFILISGIIALTLLGGYGLYELFQVNDVVLEKVDNNAQLSQAFKDYPQIRYNFNKSTGRILLLGHVLTAPDRNQILYNLQSLPFISKIDDNLIIDEYVWQEANQVMSKNPTWKTMNINANEPGHFVLTGFLKTKIQATALSDYLSLNFPYPELLEKKVLVEEEVVSKVNQTLNNDGINNIKVELSNGDITLSGSIPFGKKEELEKAIAEIKSIPGVRTLKNFVTEQEPEELMVNLSGQYEVTGFSNTAGTNVSVVINGRILTVGDTIDGMKIVSVRPGTVFLEKDGFKYRIDYNK